MSKTKCLFNSRLVAEETKRAAATARIDDDDDGLHSLSTTTSGGTVDRCARCPSICPTIFPWRRSQLAKRGKSVSTISIASTSDRSLLCSCDSVAMLKEDLSILQIDTKEAVTKAWKQTESLDQEIMKKRAYIEELRWQINFCNERNAQALKYLECSECEMDMMQTADHCEDEENSFSKILQSSLCTFCVDIEKSDLLYADMRLMMASRDLTIEAMQEALKGKRR